VTSPPRFAAPRIPGPPVGDRRWLILSTALGGVFATGVTVTLLSVSLVTIARDLGSTTGTLTWLVTGPMLGAAVVGPAAGKAGDLFGHRRVYLVGLAGCCLFSLLTGFANGPGTLIAFRIIGAALGSFTWPTSLAMINQVFPAEGRAKAMGYWSLVSAGSPVLGVVIGGPAVEAFGWRTIFFAQVPIIAVAALVCARLLPETIRRRGAAFDGLGAVLLAGAALSLILALNLGPRSGWTSAPVVVGGALAPLLAATFVAWERRCPQPLLPLGAFRRRNVAFPIASQMATNMAYTGSFVLTPLLLAEVMGYSEGRTGLLNIARPLAFAMVGPIAGSWAVRAGERTMGVAGSLSVALAMAGLALVRPGTGDVWVVGALALSGMGLGALSPAMTSSLANAIDPADLGVWGAAQQMLNQVGAVTGIQVLRTVQEVTEGRLGLADSYGLAYLVGAGAAAVGLVLALFVSNSRRSRLAVPPEQVPALDLPPDGSPVAAAQGPAVHVGAPVLSAAE
jgi:EmrB/QacA subfamily drug resistance transporter